jgi:hypothetical protein
MAVIESPDQPVEQLLLRDLERVDEMLLEELERVDEVLRRIVGAIDQLPERIASASRRELGPLSGNGTRAAEPATRPFDPYGEDEVEAEDKKPAAIEVTRKVQSWVAAYAPDREALGFATLSLAVALVATAIAVVGLVAVVLP